MSEEMSAEVRFYRLFLQGIALTSYVQNAPDPSAAEVGNRLKVILADTCDLADSVRGVDFGEFDPDSSGIDFTDAGHLMISLRGMRIGVITEAESAGESDQADPPSESRDAASEDDTEKYRDWLFSDRSRLAAFENYADSALSRGTAEDDIISCLEDSLYESLVSNLEDDSCDRDSYAAAQYVGEEPTPRVPAGIHPERIDFQKVAAEIVHADFPF